MKMTPWELRGYLAYPHRTGAPRPGTNEETNWARGWTRAQSERINKADPTGYSAQNYFGDHDF